jgi:DNA-directed RNA polymerase subunit RPC12/RpoP
MLSTKLSRAALNWRSLQHGCCVWRLDALRVEIVDPTTHVEHGGRGYRCPSCSEAMEQPGSGSDPHAMRHENDLPCAHCGVAIVDEQTRGDDAFCCAHCARAAA